ncbi:iron ABC transporter permease [Vibrio sp. ABG19]|nr:iron ABC transporter permease [Vibrio sp. ABG19]WGY45809.1 iron ABC transporter permease [Vibrio sp. ABG19]
MPEPLIYRGRLGSFSLPSTALRAVVGLMLLTLGIAVISLSSGSEWINPWQLMSGSLNGELSTMVETLRLPRIVMGMLVGAGLGCSGLILQSVIRNPLASPDVVGMTSGACAAAVGFLAFFQMSYGIGWLPLFALGGAFFASGAVYLLAWRQGVTPMRMILVGIGVSAAMGAVTTLLIAISPSSGSLSAYIWLTGSIYGANWHDVQSLLPWLMVGFPLALCFSRQINAQELGDPVATGLGISVQKLRLMLVMLSILLAAPVVAYAGAIGFVGLIAPHIARQLVTRSFALLLPVTAMVGACLVMSADLAARVLFVPLDLPAGVFVSAIGAPFFIYLLFRQRT